MQLKSLLFSSFVALGVSVAAAPAHGPTCTQPLIRKEWRSLSIPERHAFIGAVQCMQRLPSRDHTASGVRTRFEDFISVHQLQAPFIHFVGHFHAWHRYMIHTFEDALRNECHYPGALPYWDWSLDAAHPSTFYSSPVFDPITGFGGDGSKDNTSVVTADTPIPEGDGGGCIQTGPFRNLQVNVGPLNSTTYNPHCVRRSFDTVQAVGLTPAVVKTALQSKTFAELMVHCEGDFNNPDPTKGVIGYHGRGHWSVGGLRGTMSDVSSSPSDPLFYLHHANVDRIWTLWQKYDHKRYTEVAGTSTPFTHPFTPDPSGTPVTLKFPINLNGDKPAHALNVPVTVGDLMNTKAGPLCYDYLG